VLGDHTGEAARDGLTGKSGRGIGKRVTEMTISVASRAVAKRLAIGALPSTLRAKTMTSGCAAEHSPLARTVTGCGRTFQSGGTQCPWGRELR